MCETEASRLAARLLCDVKVSKREGRLANTASEVMDCMSKTRIRGSEPQVCVMFVYRHVYLYPWPFCDYVTACNMPPLGACDVSSL